MIAAIIVGAYLAFGLAVGRWTALRRMESGQWCEAPEGNQIAVGLSIFFWPVAGPIHLATLPPKSTRGEREQARIDKLERELGMR